MTWMSSKPAEIAYSFGYYRELCPAILRLACLDAGFAPVPDGPTRYLELGFGQGVDVALHAASNAATFWGTDYNPTHAAHAQGLVAASGARAMLCDDSFADFAARLDLPAFDVIALHGVWSWISEADGQIVIDLIRRKLRVGGMVYASYNCLPGMAPLLPLRNLMKLHSDLAGSAADGMAAGIDGAIGFARTLIDANSVYFRANPGLEAKLQSLTDQGRDYLAHEYFVPDWRVMGFADFAAHMEQAKLSYATSAYLLNHIDAICLPPEGQQLLATISHPVLREATRDCLTNQGFRRDIFIKGPRRLSPVRRWAALRAQSYILLTPPNDVPAKNPGPFSEATIPEAVFTPLIAALAAQNYAPKSIDQLLTVPGLAYLTVDKLHAILLLLTGAGHLGPTQPPSAETLAQCRAFNQHVMDNNAVGNSVIAYLASPVIGGGVPVFRVQQMCLLGMQQGLNDAPALARYVWQLMSRLGERIIRNGEKIMSDDETIAELERALGEFIDQRVPLLRALGVV